MAHANQFRTKRGYPKRQQDPDPRFQRRSKLQPWEPRYAIFVIDTRDINSGEPESQFGTEYDTLEEAVLELNKYLEAYPTVERARIVFDGSDVYNWIR